MIFWPEFRFPPINLYSYPKSNPMCKSIPIHRSLVVGDLIQDTSNKVWVVIRIEGNIAYYGKTIDSEIENCFIHTFNTNGRELGYNEFMRLVVSEEV